MNDYCYHRFDIIKLPYSTRVLIEGRSSLVRKTITVPTENECGYNWQTSLFVSITKCHNLNFRSLKPSKAPSAEIFFEWIRSDIFEILMKAPFAQ